MQHPATPISDAVSLTKKRGSYNCGRCGVPKKGHKCPFSIPKTTTPVILTEIVEDNTSSAPLPVRSLRRTLSFDDNDDNDDVLLVNNNNDDEAVVLVKEELVDDDVECVDLVDYDSDENKNKCLWEILRRLPPTGLLVAARVCRGWRDMSKKVWKGVEELRLRVPVYAQIGLVGSVLQKCPGLIKLSLRMESDVDATILACIAFSCRNLQTLEILMLGSSVNRIAGDDLSRFVAEKRCLTSLKMEGCSNLGGFVLSSSTLSTLWLSDLHSVTKMVFNCPNLKEISLCFSRQENDSTDLTAAMDVLGRTCPKLHNIHIASARLSHAAVLALTAAKLRGLRMLSLILGSEITDASVAAIASSFTKLELLDLSGSSMSDSGIGMICNVFPDTLSKLLLALCPNITSSGIQFAAAQLPHLELMDCGMTLCDPDSETSVDREDNDCKLQKTPNSKLHLIYQKLIIKHNRLKKLSLWGCSGLDALYLNCPRLNDLNLNCCTNLHPERLLLQCPNLESVHASECEGMLVKTIKSQVNDDLTSVESPFPLKRLPDGSKRVRAQCFTPQPPDDEKKWRRPVKRQCQVIVIS